MGEAARKRITIDEFLAWEGEGDRRYELVAGEIVAMAPPTNAHAIIVANVVAALRQGVNAPCRVLSEAGIVVPFRHDSFYQADAAVSCAPVAASEHGIADPTVIVEVLSPSTTVRDRGIKLTDYRMIGSVQDIVIIATDKARIEHWRRSGAESWTVLDLDLHKHLHLMSIGFEAPVAAFYDGLDFPAG